MNLTVLASNTRVEEKYKLLDKSLNKLIENSGYYLFTILCGQQEETEIGKKWAMNNGAPIQYIKASSSKELIDKLLWKSDYVVFILDGTAAINNAFMKYKSTGKHGTVIKLKR